MDANITWKDVVGYEGLYKVSSDGQIYTNYYKRLLKQHEKNGYRYVYLCRNGEQKFKFIHRLVAEAYISNPNNYPCVNHKDETRDNNKVENLEWCNHYYNNHYGTHSEKLSKALTKGCVAVNPKTDEIVMVCGSRKNAANKVNVQPTNITAAINHNGRKKTAGGYKWYNCPIIEIE